jgi:uncharacterized membrane-anchored protein
MVPNQKPRTAGRPRLKLRRLTPPIMPPHNLKPAAMNALGLRPWLIFSTALSGSAGGSLSLFSLVIATIGIWYWTLGSVAVQTVVSPKVETFYWTTIMFSQTLGTALGDWMADNTGLGYNGSAVLIALVLAILALFYFFTSVSRTLLFWSAFILTRPLGATIANSFDKPVAQGGLAVGDLKASAVLAVLIVISILLIPQRPGRHVGDPASP